MVESQFSTMFPYVLLIVFFRIVILLKRKGVVQKEINVKKGIYSFLMIIFISYNLVCENIISFLGMTNAITSIMALLVLSCYIYHVMFYKHDNNFWLMTGSVFLSFLTITGNRDIFDVYGWRGYIFSFASWSILYWCLIESCYWLSNLYKLFDENVERKDYLKWGMITFFSTCLVNLIFLLVYFPGVMSYDSLIQMFQVTGGVEYSNHHPWLHTLYIKFIYELGLKVLGSANKAYALYSVSSICLIAFSFACVASYMRKKGLKKKGMVILILCYVLSPINQMYSITMWKDVPFSAVVLIYMVLLCVMCDNQREERTNKLNWFLFVPLSFGVCFLRSNGLYMFLGTLPFIIWKFWREKRQAVIAIGVVLVLGGIYKGPVFERFNVSEPDMIESLSIPAQQIAAVVAYDGEISDAQMNLLEYVIDVEKIADAYLSSVGCSDNIKNLIRDKGKQEYIKENIDEFLKLYIDLFENNKRIYVRAFIDETGGYWYHQVSFPFLWATYIEENGMGIERDSKVSEQMVEGFNTYLKSARNFWNKYCSIGLIVYMFFIALFVALQKKSPFLIVYLPSLGIWGTLLLATPVHADMRYAYSIYISIPILISLIFWSENDEKQN